MTDKEKAEEHTKENYCKKCNLKDCSRSKNVNCYVMHTEDYLAGLAEGRKESEKENAELKAQIEDMKNVGNCEHALNCARWVQQHITSNKVTCCKGCSEWELKK